MSAINAKEIAKVYKQYPSRRDRLFEWLSMSRKKRHTNFWALKDIDFDIPKGSVTAFLGVNGTGKSTLLKILAGTTKATQGHFHLSGNLAALIELGIGFHPEFTGRENILLTGQLLGFSEQELKALTPQIIEYAEIGNYFDQPLRTYSSGMQARLAFSLATVRAPDIFIVDEALSVGDVYFQQKSFSRIRQLRDQGTTILFVSHDKETILSICDHVILMDHGRILDRGSPQAMVDLYMAMLADPKRQAISQTLNSDGLTQTISGTGEANVTSIQLRPIDQDETKQEQIPMGQATNLEICVRAHSQLDKLVVGIAIKNSIGQVIYGTNTFLSNQVMENVPAGSDLVYRFEFSMNIAPGHYSISTSLAGANSHIEKNYEWKDLAHHFEVVNPTSDKSSQFYGSTWLPPKVSMTSLPTDSPDSLGSTP